MNVASSPDAPPDRSLSTFRKRLDSVRQRVRDACDRAGRDPEEVRICPVAKGRRGEAYPALREEGIDLVGENRVGEAERKFRFLPEEMDVHMVGHLQTNKAPLAVRVFDGIQSVDRPDIVEALDRNCRKRDLIRSVYLQVNVSGEEAKHGVAPGELADLYEAAAEAESLTVQGLMTIAPHTDQPEETRPVFARTRELLEEIGGTPGGSAGPSELSMGMTQDFEIAVEEGATLVRPGRAIFEGTAFE